MSLDKDIDEYAEAARQHGEATTAADAPRANRAFDRLDRCWKRIRTSTEDWRPVFFALLEHENAWVRLWAASHALHSVPESALAVLEALTTEPGVLGFDAQMTIETWEKGKLGERN